MSSVVAGLALTAAPAVFAAGNEGNPGVAPPQSTPRGRTYGEWSARWWQWAVSIPPATNPLLDASGDDCGQGQSGQVFFLGGTFDSSGTATRYCTVPTGKSIFFPILNVIWANDPGGSATAEDLRALAKSNMDGATDMSCEVDGTSIQNLGAYRAASVVFDLVLPSDNIFAAPAGTYTPAVDDGVYLMLEPLSVGEHTIHFHGTIPDFSFTLDITYHLTVAPH